jgi:hypothetical protein
MVLSKIGEWFDTSKITNASELVAINVAKVLLIIGGAFAAKKGSLLVAQLVSQSTGMSEGTSQGQSMGMLRGGLGIAKSALRAGGAGALLAMKGGAGASSAVGGVGNALASATGGTGRASIGGGAGGDAIGAAASGGSKLKSALSTAGNTAKGAATSVGNALATGGIFGLAGYGAAKLAKGAVKAGKGAAKLTGKAAKGAGNIAMKGADAVGLGGKLRYGATKTKLWGASVANKAKGLATSVKGRYDNAVGKYHANRLDKYSEQQNKLLANAENMWANVDKKDGKKYAGGVTDLQRSSTSSYDRKFDRLERKIKKGNDFINRQNNFNNNAGTTQPPTA